MTEFITVAVWGLAAVMVALLVTDIILDWFDNWLP